MNKHFEIWYETDWDDFSRTRHYKKRFDNADDATWFIKYLLLVKGKDWHCHIMEIATELK
jgi:hypothetical protein